MYKVKTPHGFDEYYDGGTATEPTTTATEIQVEEHINIEITESPIANMGTEDLTVFIENLTSERMIKIQDEIDMLPVVTDRKTYDITFSMHQVLKKFRQLLKKSVEQKISDKKSEWLLSKHKLELDHETVLKKLLPMENQLAESRSWWDMLTDAYKMNAAHDIAATQKKEFERQEKIRIQQEYDRKHESALIDNKQFDIDKQQEEDAKALELANDALEQKRLSLEREKYEFSCSKSRLDFNAAYNEAFPEKESLIVNLKGLSELEEAPDAPTIIDHAGYLDKFAASSDKIDKKLDELESGVEISRDLDQNDEPVEYEQHGTPDEHYQDINKIDTVTGSVISITESFITELKGHINTGLNNNRKLENFILSTEINFNTFKKAVE